MKVLMFKKPAIICIIAALCALLVGCSPRDTVSFTVNDTLPDGDGRVARVILLGGQSNASGCSRDDYLKKKVSAEKYAEYKNGYDNIYINYLSGDKRSNGFVRCATLQGELDGCFGPELGIADRLNEMYPDESFYIIKCAWGGSNLFKQWLSPSSRGRTGDLYKQFEEFVRTSVRYLESKGYEVKIEGMCWMQGESDSFSAKNATDYEKHLNNLIKDIRKSFSEYASEDGIAFIDAYIADNPVFWVYCDLVNKSKLAVAEGSDVNVLVDTVSHGLSCAEEPEESPDLAHYDSLSELKLGHLFAEELARFLN